MPIKIKNENIFAKKISKIFLADNCTKVMNNVVYKYMNKIPYGII